MTTLTQGYFSSFFLEILRPFADAQTNFFPRFLSVRNNAPFSFENVKKNCNDKGLHAEILCGASSVVIFHVRPHTRRLLPTKISERNFQYWIGSGRVRARWDGNQRSARIRFEQTHGARNGPENETAVAREASGRVELLVRSGAVGALGPHGQSRSG